MFHAFSPFTGVLLAENKRAHSATTGFALLCYALYILIIAEIHGLLKGHFEQINHYFWPLPCVFYFFL